MPGAHLTQRHAAFRAAVEAQENRREILGLDVEGVPPIAAGRRKGSSGCVGLEPHAHDRREVRQHGDDSPADDMLHQIDQWDPMSPMAPLLPPFSGSRRQEKSVGYSSQSCR